MRSALIGMATLGGFVAFETAWLFNLLANGEYVSLALLLAPWLLLWAANYVAKRFVAARNAFRDGYRDEMKRRR